MYLNLSFISSLFSDTLMFYHDVSPEVNSRLHKTARESERSAVLLLNNLLLTVSMRYFCCGFSVLLMSLTIWQGKSGGAMVLGKLPVPGRPTIRMIVG